MSVLTTDQARQLYDRIADRYDVWLIAYRLAGIEQQRELLVRQLGLTVGATVIDLCCGTGKNLPYLVDVVGPGGHVIGVDFSAGMLDRASAKAKTARWTNVELIHADVESWPIPPDATAVLSTFGLEMVPGYESVIERVASALPANGRLGLLGLKYPHRWPNWLVNVGLSLNKPFGVSTDYASFKPWQAAERHLDVSIFSELLFGAAYCCIGVKRSDGRGKGIPDDQ